LWRAANPFLEPALRQILVKELMSARRAVLAALQSGDADDLSSARAGSKPPRKLSEKEEKSGGPMEFCPNFGLDGVLLVRPFVRFAPKAVISNSR
jgi:hypothetical protein